MFEHLTHFLLADDGKRVFENKQMSEKARKIRTFCILKKN